MDQEPTLRRVVLVGRSGFDLPGVGPGVGRAETALDRLVPLFLCSEDGWDVRRVVPGGPRSLRRALGSAWVESLDVSVLVLEGSLVDVDGHPALTVDEDWALDPDAATVPVEWILSSLRASARGPSVAILALAGPRPFPAVGTDGPTLLAVAADGALLTAFADAVAGGAGQDGAITLAALARALAPYAVGPSPGEDRPLMLVPSALALREIGLAPRRNANPDPEDLTGTVLPGRFLVDGPLGSGTFGDVYRARQLGLDRIVAVKVLRRTVDDSPEDVLSFAREARSAGRLHHPNVVRLYHCDITPGGRLFAAMELLHGETLAAAMNQGPLPRERALRRIREILAGLAAAHGEGLVHADVKPANVMIVPDATAQDGERAVLLDFGLALLRPAGVPLGGTPLYMAPEHVRGGPIDARADVYAVGLLMVEALTGWTRASGALDPPLAELALAPELRVLLGRALASDPARRHPSALELLRELDGESVHPDPSRDPLPLAPLQEADGDRLVGRDSLLRGLTLSALFRRLTVLVSASGMGKTSVLRAGLIPRLRALRRTVVYVDGRSPAESEPADVWIVDQAEALLVARRPVPTGGGALVIAVRDEFLSALIRALPRELAAEAVFFHLEPMGIEDGRAALARTLALVRVRPAEGLLEAIVADLARADLPGGHTGGVYPPHVGLTCLALRDAAMHRGVVGLQDYTGAGGLAGILRDHLDRVLDRELPPEATSTARAVFTALVTDGGVAVHCAVADLPPRAEVVIDALRDRGLVVPVDVDGAPGWALAHESLGPQVLKWADARDLDRRRAREVVRYHLLRSTEARPSLLSARDLRDVDRNPGVLASVQTTGSGVWTPETLVRASRRRVRTQRLQRAAGALLLAAALAIAGQKGVEVYGDSRADIGRVRLVLAPIDWDPERYASVPAHERPTLAVRWWEPPRAEEGEPRHPIGRPVGPPTFSGAASSQVYAVRAGPGWLEIHRDGCPPSWVVLPRLPGYLERTDPPAELRIEVPTCQASRANTVLVEAGPFWEDGPAEPPLVRHPEFAQQPELAVTLPAFRIDRTEVPVAWFTIFARHARWTGIGEPGRLGAPEGGSDAVDLPRTNLSWAEARAFCRYLGMDLPTASQYEKAARGGWVIGGRPNPEPRRALPWGSGPGWVNLAGDADGFLRLAPVHAGAAGASPYGVLQLAGNAWEWQRDGPSDQPGNVRWIRGGSQDTPVEEELHAIPYRNIRDKRFISFDTGFRCVEDPPPDTHRRVPE